MLGAGEAGATFRAGAEAPDAGDPAPDGFVPVAQEPVAPSRPGVRGAGAGAGARVGVGAPPGVPVRGAEGAGDVLFRSTAPRTVDASSDADGPGEPDPPAPRGTSVRGAEPSGRRTASRCTGAPSPVRLTAGPVRSADGRRGGASRTGRSGRGRATGGGSAVDGAATTGSSGDGAFPEAGGLPGRGAAARCAGGAALGAAADVPVPLRSASAGVDAGLGAVGAAAGTARLVRRAEGRARRPAAGAAGALVRGCCFRGRAGSTGVT